MTKPRTRAQALAQGKDRRKKALLSGNVAKRAMTKMSPSDKIEHERGKQMRAGLARRKKHQSDYDKQMKGAGY